MDKCESCLLDSFSLSVIVNPASMVTKNVCQMCKDTYVKFYAWTTWQPIANGSNNQATNNASSNNVPSSQSFILHNCESCALKVATKTNVSPQGIKYYVCDTCARQMPTANWTNINNPSATVSRSTGQVNIANAVSSCDICTKSATCGVTNGILTYKSCDACANNYIGKGWTYVSPAQSGLAAAPGSGLNMAPNNPPTQIIDYLTNIADNMEYKKDKSKCECGNQDKPMGTQLHSHWCPGFKIEF